MRRKVTQPIGRPGEISRKKWLERGSSEKSESRGRLRLDPGVPKKVWFGFSGTQFSDSVRVCLISGENK